MICYVMESFRELSVDAEALYITGRGPLAPISIPSYILLQLWFATAHSIVVYIVPVFKKHSVSFLYSFPQVWDINSMTLHILDSQTTQGTWFLVTAGAHKSKSVCLLSVEIGWLLFPRVRKPFRVQSRRGGQ